jgi:hypothetical protein
MIKMSNTYQSASQDLLIEDLGHIYEITEEELATASVLCTCTSTEQQPAATGSVLDGRVEDLEQVAS